MKIYDYIIVGSGLFGAVFAREATNRGKRVLVIDKRPHIGGNIYTEDVQGINVHKYGAHIFHTNNDIVWQYVNKYAEFNNFINTPVANYKGEIFSLPFNMFTFNKIWGCISPEEAFKIINEQRKKIGIFHPKNLEEQAIALVGQDIYEKLIKGYTEKQWGKSCKDLPSSIIRRLPVRLEYNNNYFNAKYQGVPTEGYTNLIHRLLEGIPVKLNANFFDNKYEYQKESNKIIFTGSIDSYFDYSFGQLEYRSVNFEEEIINQENYQGVAVMNFTDKETPWTRIIEHKWFQQGRSVHGEKVPYTIISKEFSQKWNKEIEPYYPINDTKNNFLYEQYRKLSLLEKNVIFGGRLGEYKYYDMDKVIESSLALVKTELIDG